MYRLRISACLHVCFFCCHTRVPSINDSGAALARLWRGSGAALARLWRGFGAALARLRRGLFAYSAFVPRLCALRGARCAALCAACIVSPDVSRVVHRVARCSSCRALFIVARVVHRGARCPSWRASCHVSRVVSRAVSRAVHCAALCVSQSALCLLCACFVPAVAPAVVRGCAFFFLCTHARTCVDAQILSDFKVKCRGPMLHG